MCTPSQEYPNLRSIINNEICEEGRKMHEGDRDMERDRSRKRGACSIASQAFIILQLRYRIIFSVRVGINERIKMHIPASSFACLRIGSS